MSRWARLVLLLTASAFAGGWTADGLAETRELPGASGESPAQRPSRAKPQRSKRERRASAAHHGARKSRAHRKSSRASRGTASRKHKKPSRARAARREPKLKTKWHAAPEPGDCPELDAAEPGSWGVLPIKTSECIVMPMIDPQHPEIAPEALEQAAVAFASKRNGSIHPVHPRLLQMLQRGVTHFNVPYVHLISGFRTGSSASRHSHGLAADVVFPGVENREVAAYMREQGFMGVGIYVKTGFVHLDVRERSYFWLDYSPPGKKWRGKPVRMAEAREADEAAIERGEAPFVPPGEMQTALEARLAAKERQRARRAKREADKKKRLAQARRAKKP